MPAPSDLLQYAISGATLGRDLWAGRLGFTVIFNTTEIINFAQGEFVMLGGMVAVFAIRWGGLPTSLAVPLAIGLTTLVGVVANRLTIRPVSRPLRDGPHHHHHRCLHRPPGAAMLLFGKDTYSLPGFSGGGAHRVPGASLCRRTCGSAA